jgi:hypothetical protein
VSSHCSLKAVRKFQERRINCSFSQYYQAFLQVSQRWLSSLHALCKCQAMAGSLVRGESGQSFICPLETISSEWCHGLNSLYVYCTWQAWEFILCALKVICNGTLRTLDQWKLYIQIVLSSGIQRPVVRWKSADVLKEHVASIFVALLANCFVMVSFLAYTSTLRMEATYSSETLVGFQQTTWRYIPQYRTLHDHCCENL